MTVNEHENRPTVVVVGGGYAGTAVAKALDETTNVVLVEPKDAFMHNVAALRALVDPSWLPRIFLPYEGLLAHGRVVRDRAARVEPGLVVTDSGEQIAADYVVLATGSSYAFPAKTDQIDTEKAQEQVRAAHRALARADRVLPVGCGTGRHRTRRGDTSGLASEVDRTARLAWRRARRSLSAGAAG
jgi:apoptosis-inducing factor 2